MMPPLSSAIETTEAIRSRVYAGLNALGAQREAREAAEPARQQPTAPAAQTTTAVEEDRPRRSQATVLVDLALAAGVELWHTPSGDAYVTIDVAGHREHHPLSGRAFRDWLARLHHTQTTRTPGSQAVADALGTLGGMARYDGAEHPVSVRVGAHAGAIYLDLAAPDWSAVEITDEGWRLVPNPPVRFRRGRALLPLPVPTRGGSVEALRELVLLHCEDDWRLTAAFLIGTLRPTGPYTLLALDGEQGTGKSTTARLLRRLVDPSAAELRAGPREIRDLMIAASSGWIVALDNVSHLQPWLSDALCRISTGRALSTRQLYTDGDEHIVEAVRPIILTGITSAITRGDLQDRAIAITLPVIADTERRPEAALWAAFEEIRPAVLGALLDATACALRREATVVLDRLPRMADFARWVTAAEPALGWADGALLAAYMGGQQQAIEVALDGDPVAVALRAVGRPWAGTTDELLTLISPTGSRPPRGWPESPRGLTAALTRLAPQLRRIGIEVHRPDSKSRKGHDRDRILRIEDVGARPSASSASSIGRELLSVSADGPADGSADGRPIVRTSSAGSPSSDEGAGGADGADDSPPILLTDRLEASWRNRL